MPKLEGALERGELGSPGLGGLVHKIRRGGEGGKPRPPKVFVAQLALDP